MRHLLSGEKSIWTFAKRNKVVTFLVCTIVAMGMSGVGLMAYTSQDTLAAGQETITRRSHQDIVEAIENQMAILKWVGGAIVAGLTSAVGLLFRALEKSQAQTHEDLSEGIKSRSKLVGLMVEAIENVESEIKEMRDDLTQIKAKQNGK